MLTPFDDFPIHQTAAPITQPASGDPNHYDRYFFNGHDRDGALFLAAAMGHYPNRGVIDAAFSVVHDGVQRSVFTSGLMHPERRTEIGPVHVDVVEPLRTIRLVVGPNDHGLEADLTFRARTAAVEEPRQTVARGGRLVMDYTRLTQWGTWDGWVVVDGARVVVDPASVLGTRDRSWGVRPVGAQVAVNSAPGPRQLFWLWAPLHFDDVCTHLALFEHGDGTRWLESALVIPVLTSADAPTWGGGDSFQRMAGVRYALRWRRGGREIEAATLTFEPRGGAGDTFDIDFEPLCTFRMRGIGYTHPEWGHGSVHGPLAVGGEAIAVSDFSPADPTTLHVQTVCRVKMGARSGVGVLEQLAVGDHEPTGLHGLFEGYQPPG